MIHHFIFSLQQLRSMIVYNACPACGHKDIFHVLIAEDYTVSHGQFEIWQCNNCTLRFTQNVPDQNEISRYYQSENYISHSDTSKGFINKLYHAVRKKTLTQKKNLIEKFFETDNGCVLDVGAGTGAFLSVMKQGGWSVSGIETDSLARAKAKKLYDINLFDSEVFFSLQPQQFNVITMWHVLEHVHDLHGYLRQLKKLLKPGGKIFIAVPNYTSRDAKIYKQFWAAYDVPRHLYHFSPASMQTLLAKFNFKINTLKPMWFDSFYVSMLSEKYKTGKTNFIKASLIGLLSNAAATSNTGKCSSVIYIVSM